MTFKTTVRLSTQNRENIKKLKKVTRIEKGNPITESKIINTAISEFFKNNTVEQDKQDYTQQLEVLKCYNLI